MHAKGVVLAREGQFAWAQGMVCVCVARDGEHALEADHDTPAYRVLSIRVRPREWGRGPGDVTSLFPRAKPWFSL